MSCHARQVEGLSEALVPLRWTHKEGLFPRRASPERASVGRSRRVAQPRHLAKWLRVLQMRITYCII
jgi:hypothetical protein